MSEEKIAQSAASAATAPSAGGSASEPRWTVRSMLAWSRDWLAKKGIENPRLDAELLLANALQVARIKLYVDHDKPLEGSELARFKSLILRRAEREPVAYLLGTKEFYGRPFAVDKRAFIPRPETELLVQALLADLSRRHPEIGAAGALRVLDLCAGSGAIGATLAAERADLTVDLVELSPETAEVTRANAQAIAPERTRVLVGDLFAPLSAGTRYDAVATNPPYIPLRDAHELAPEIARHEPRLALFSGDDGLDLIRRIVVEVPRWLVPGGLLALELDPSQAESAIALCSAAGLVGARIEKDLAGLARILLAQAP